MTFMMDNGPRIFQTVKVPNFGLMAIHILAIGNRVIPTGMAFIPGELVTSMKEIMMREKEMAKELISMLMDQLMLAPGLTTNSMALVRGSILMEILTKVNGLKVISKEREHLFGKIIVIIMETCIQGLGEIIQNMALESIDLLLEQSTLVFTTWESDRVMVVSLILMDTHGLDIGTMISHVTWITPYIQICEMSLTQENAPIP